MKKLYLDANIYLDWWFDRKDNKLPLGEFAYQLFRRTFECEFMVIYSEAIVSELCNVLNISNELCFERFFKKLGDLGKLEFVSANEFDSAEIETLVKQKILARKDAEHLVLSIKSNSILVSRNYHLINLNGFSAIKPENL